jgi:hypothetical protein
VGTVSVEKVIPFASTKARDQLLSEYKEIRENSYVRMFKIPILLLSLSAISYSFPSFREDKVLIWVILIAYLLLDNILSVGRIEKKMNVLYEIEKNRNFETNKDEH